MNAWQLDPQLANDSHPISTGALCDIRLVDDANYPWLIVVPRVVDACELFDLDSRQRGALIEEIVCADQARKAMFTPDQFTFAAHGLSVRPLPLHGISAH